MKPIIILFLFLFLFCFVDASQAQSGYEVRGDSLFYIYTLETIVVYAEKKLAPSSVVELKPDEITGRNAVTVADALRSESGLSVTTGAKAETATKIRGFNARDVLVMVDGRPINPGYYGKVDLSMLPVDNIAKIQVTKGPASVAYGANNMGGVINIVTRNGLETPNTVFESEFGDFNYRKININHSRQHGRFNYWLSAYDNHSDGFRLSDDFESTSLEDGGLRDNSYYHKTGVNGKIGFRPDETSLYSLSAGYHWAKKDVPATIYSWDSPYYRKFPEWLRLNSSLSGYWQVKPTLEFKGMVFFDAYNDRFISYQNREMQYDEIVFDSKLENWTVGGSFDGKIMPWPKHRVRTGIGFKRDLMNKKPDVNESWYSHYVLTGNAFAEDNYNIWGKTELTLGLSYNLFATDEDNSQSNNFCPMVGLNQKLPFMLELHASYANAIRFPTLHHLYSESSGNHYLLPEEADKFEVGLKRWFMFEKNSRYFSLELVFFRNELKNLIYRASKSYRYENIDEATLQGWEAELAWSFSTAVYGEISYGYIKPSESSEILLEEISKNKWHFQITAMTPFGTKFNCEYNYFDERTTYMTDFNLVAYELVNVNLSQELSGFLNVYIKINNLTDEYYQDELGYPAPGRQFIGGISLDL